MKRIIIILIIISITSCKTESKQDDLPIIRTVSKLNSKVKNDSLLIEGKNIWIRSLPKTGKIIMKLDNGANCTIIDTSLLDTVKGCIDYWYKIEHNDSIGWVFGSQTSIKSNCNKEILLFLKKSEEKLKCRNVDYTIISDENHYLSSIILTSGGLTIDTLNFNGKKVSYERGDSAVNMKDLNFDGFCDFSYRDIMSASHYELDYYYFIYNPTTKKYNEDSIFPKRHAGLKIDRKKKEILFEHSYDGSFSTIKF